MQYLESLGDVPVLHKPDEGESPAYESHCSEGEHIVTTSNVTHPSHLNTLLLSPSLTIYVPHPSLTPPSPLPHHSHTPQSLLTHLLHPLLPLTCHILTSSTPFSLLPSPTSLHSSLVIIHYLSSPFTTYEPSLPSLPTLTPHIFPVGLLPILRKEQ